MKSAKEWATLFTNQHIINTRGQEVEEFIKSVQNDAQVDIELTIDGIIHYQESIIKKSEEIKKYLTELLERIS